MNTLVAVLFNGLAIGSVYALISLGFSLVHKASGAVNFAHGSLLLLGGYLVAVLHQSSGFPLALLLAAAATALVAVLEGLLLHRVRDQGAAVPTVLTIGVDILLFTELARQIGANVLNLGDPWGARTVELLGVTVAQAQVASFLAAVVLVSGFLAVFRWSRWGLAMRASASDPEAAALMGVRGGPLRAVAWALAGAMATVAAVFLTAFPTPGLDSTTGQVAMLAFPAAIVGGLGSIGGALAGSLLIGVAEALSAGYQQQLSLLGPGLSDVAPYLVMVLVLLARPQGLLGTKEASRV